MNNLTWMKGSNFGDAINPKLYEYISGKSPDWKKLGELGDTYMMVGSILNHAKPRTIVWGAGIALDHGNNVSKCDIRAVRGPLTREVMLRNGVDCPEVYGDPVLLMPRYYKPNVSKEYKLGIIPHVLERDLIHVKHSDINVIDLRKTYKEIINEICKCEAIVSSSLHGLIAADAYGIKSKWVEFSNKVVGNGFKFRDYYMSIGYFNETPLDMRAFCEYPVEKILTYVENHDMQVDMELLYDACPFKK
tara:strand:+ start:74522 stop:75262 length:741 start_codon:yes stop_codon:yes gene_type:complete